MQIVQFTKKYLDEMAQLFADVYSETDEKWDIVAARKYLQNKINDAPKYCLVALNDQGLCLGAVFCSLYPSPRGQALSIDSVQVRSEFRKQGIAKELFMRLFCIAQKNNIENLHLLADSRKEFPKRWFEQIGFKLDNWVSYVAKWDDIKIV